MALIITAAQIPKHTLKMDLKFTFEVARQTRKNTLYFLDGLDEDRINTIPEGFKNNIAWNLGHILITFQILVYKNAGLEMNLPIEWIDRYKKGSFPAERIKFDEFEAIKEMFVPLIDKAEEDYEKGIFTHYNSYPTSYGIALNRVEDVFQFIYAHEAFHWGVIVAMKKLV